MNNLRLNVLATAIGLSSVFTATPVMATVNYYDWDGIFTLLDSQGGVIPNTSINQKLSNQFQTPITGTLSFDSNTGAGLATISATVAPFDFFNNEPGKPVELHNITLQAIGDGMGGAGTLVIGNMLANWNWTNDMPVSIVWDAAGLINGITNGDLDDGVLDQVDVATYGAIPASDGTYVGSTVPGTVNGPSGYGGYLGLGPAPIVTTAWNTTPNCVYTVDCIGNSISGLLPLIFDNNLNTYDYMANSGGSIGGSPMLDGPFTGISPNFDITRIEYTGEDANLQIAPFDQVLGINAVPVPAAVWLFGSGLMGLVGLAYRRKS